MRRRRRVPFAGLDQPKPAGVFGILCGALGVVAVTFGLIWGVALLEAALQPPHPVQIARGR